MIHKYSKIISSDDYLTLIDINDEKTKKSQLTYYLKFRSRKGVPIKIDLDKDIFLFLRNHGNEVTFIVPSDTQRWSHIESLRTDNEIFIKFIFDQYSDVIKGMDQVLYPQYNFTRDGNLPLHVASQLIDLKQFFIEYFGIPKLIKLLGYNPITELKCDISYLKNNDFETISNNLTALHIIGSMNHFDLVYNIKSENLREIKITSTEQIDRDVLLENFPSLEIVILNDYPEVIRPLTFYPKLLKTSLGTLNGVFTYKGDLKLSSVEEFNKLKNIHTIEGDLHIRTLPQNFHKLKTITGDIIVYDFKNLETKVKNLTKQFNVKYNNIYTK